MGRQSDHDVTWEKRLRAVGLAVRELELWAASDGDRTNVLHTVTVKLDADGGTSVLLVLKAFRGDERVIAFVGGLDFSTALIAAYKKLRGGVLRWRTDVPYGERTR